MDLFMAGTASDLSFTLGGDSDLNYAFSIPVLKFNDADISAGGNDQDVMAKMSFTALYDDGIGGTLQITRTPAS
jgi:hypothetical protein